MSRFFRGDESSSSESESSSSSSEEEVRGAARTTVGGVGRSRFMQTDSEDEDVIRVSRSAKDRRFDALVAISNDIKNHIKNSDWSKLQEDFDSLNDALKKLLKTDLVSGKKPPVPDIYLRSIITIEEFMQKTLESKPKLSKTNNLGLNRMKLKVPKNNKLYDEDIRKIKATGKYDLYHMDSEDEDSDTDDDDESVVSASTSTTSTESDSDDNGPTMSRWLKKDTNRSSAVTAKSKRGKKQSFSKQIGETDDGDADGEAEDDKEDDKEDDGYTIVSRSKPVARETFKPENMTEEAVDTKMIEILQARGRRGTNRLEQIQIIESLLPCAKSPRQQIEIMLHLIAARFDGIPATKLFMPADLWKAGITDAAKVIALAKQHFPSIRFSDEADAQVEDPSFMLKGGMVAGEIIDPSGEAVEGTAQKNIPETQIKKTEVDAEGQIIVRGDIVTTFERFDSELYRAWQHTDAYTPEYVERLKDEVALLNLASEVQNYFETAAEREEGKENCNEMRLNALRARSARVAARRVIHMYYKPEELDKKVEQLSGRKASDKTLQELAVVVYRYGDERAKSMTMLAHVYNHALENRFFDARDMLLMSHLQDTISELDIPLQVMFNRTMTQMGLCAFRIGKPAEAHACLQELCSPSHSGGGGGLAKMKELLAQGITQQRGFEKTPEQEKAEARRQIPYHMHINLDFIETAHLTSAMLLEVPAMALSKSRGDVRRRPISKSFQYFLRNSMKQAFPGPPENTRDYVMAATRCLMRGDWKGSYDHISGIRSWKALSITTRNATLANLEELLKIEALRTFSLSYSSYYESMSTEQLSHLFGLSPAKVHSILSKMIINMEMRASWDQPTASIVMRRTEPTRLQSLALQLASKVSNMTENNEKLMDAKTGGVDRNERKDEERTKANDWKQPNRGTRGGKNRGRDREGGTRGRGDLAAAMAG